MNKFNVNIIYYDNISAVLQYMLLYTHLKSLNMLHVPGSVFKGHLFGPFLN